MTSRTLYNGNSLLTEDAYQKGLASTSYKDTDERVIYNAARATSIPNRLFVSFKLPRLGSQVLLLKRIDFHF